MEFKMTVRVASVCLALAALLTFFTIRLYSIQVVNRTTDTDAAHTFTYTTRVTAARGEILDRNGNVLVTNRASYNLVLINAVLFSSDNPNESLRRLADVCLENGYEITDQLPVTTEKPYEYTLSEASSAVQGYFRKFLDSCGWDSDISAAQLIKLLRDKYNLPAEWTEKETRMVLSLRYELDLRNCTTLPNYILMRDVSLRRALCHHGAEHSRSECGIHHRAAIQHEICRAYPRTGQPDEPGGIREVQGLRLFHGRLCGQGGAGIGV
jgi:penicillin-binding protein 2